MRIALVGVLVLLLCAPAEAATVARLGEFTLHARMEKGGQLCITLRRNRHYQGNECGPIPRSPHRAMQMLPDVGWNNYASAVPASVAFYESESPRGVKVRRRAFADPRFPAVHFAIVIAPPGVKFVRFYGADGALLGIDGGQAGYIGEDDRAPIFGTHFDGIEVHTEPLIVPTPDQADRIVTLACVDYANEGGGGGVCNENGYSQLAFMSSCRGPDIVGGIVAPGVANVRLTLGSGAFFLLPAGALPTPFGGFRGIGANVPPREAVREAVALDAAGQPVARVDVGSPPGGQPCPGPDQGDDRFHGALEPLVPPPGAVTVAQAGSVPLLVADQGETLCVTLGELGAGNCPGVPVDSDTPDLLRRGDGVAAALSRDADRVTLRFDQGEPLTVRTVDGAAYTGRWAGKVRFLAAPVPAGRRVTRVTVHNAAGAVIGVGDGPARVETRIRALADGLDLVRNTEGRPCVTASVPHAPHFCTIKNPGTPIDGPFLPYDGAVVVSCEPRRAIAYGRIAGDLALPQVVLDGGRSVRTQRIGLPGDDAWFAVLPDAGVRELRSGKRRARLALPPASAQCGYDIYRAF